ncbi:unnamed protein product [Protopolystoma xenopodis]|uniref:Uncharacterized protein n=1 Tax=Protopolystoma xenopodis TaxID=117903 RepID=A0A3S5AHK7_9PLAT|nr:unnamed protein product [Protopolystoma xenopodis]
MASTEKCSHRDSLSGTAELLCVWSNLEIKPNWTRGAKLLNEPSPLCNSLFLHVTRRRIPARHLTNSPTVFSFRRHLIEQPLPLRLNRSPRNSQRDSSLRREYRYEAKTFV